MGEKVSAGAGGDLRPVSPLLCGGLPESVTVFGRSVKVRWSHRDVLRMFSMAEDPGIPPAVKGSLAVRMFFCEDVFRLGAESGAADPGEEITEAMVSFISGGRTEKEAAAGGSAPLFDFGYDAELIYGAFVSAYGIDLTERVLHWWKFLALFRSLPAETEFMCVLAIRSGEAPPSADGEERARLRRLRARFALPVRGTAEERARAVGRAVTL